MDDEEPIPPDAELKKRLFNSPGSVEKSQTPREEEGGRSKGRGHHGGRGPSKAKRKKPKPGFRLGVFGVLLFLLLCALALVVTLQFNDDWKETTFEEVKAGKAKQMGGVLGQVLHEQFSLYVTYSVHSDLQLLYFLQLHYQQEICLRVPVDAAVVVTSEW